ncbi:TadE/TadG family type IV pilus assembly protein [Aureliella helgolandensis]|nr:TadE family protein [Aureliella helgolandensis]
MHRFTRHSSAPSSRSKTTSSSQRRGAVTVEFAICAMVFFMFVFALLELSRFLFVQHSIQMAAYEGARIGIIPGADSDAVRVRAQNILNATGVRVANIVVTPENIDSTTQEVRVAISCQFSDNSWLPPTYLSSRNVNSTIALQHENMAYLRPGDTNLEDLIGNNNNEPIDE